MSCITSIMIWGISIFENKAEIDNWLESHGHKPIGYMDALSADRIVGGEKGFSGGLCLGGFNYLEVEEFEAFLRTLDWDLLEVDLYVKRPDDDTYSKTNICNRYNFKRLCPICGKPQVDIKSTHLGRYCTCDDDE